MTRLRRAMRNNLDARAQDEGGAILVVVLFVVTVMAVVIGALLTQANASLRLTPVIRAQHDKLYAADAGIETGIQAIKRDTTLCGSATPNLPAPVPADFANGPVPTVQSVTVTCTTTSAPVNGAAGYAVILRSPTSNSLTTQGGGSKVIDGPVWAAQLPASLGITVKNGDVFEKQGRCSTDAHKPSGLVIQPPPYGYHCVTTAEPAVDHVLPTSVPATAPARSVAGSCTTFYPGKYTSPLVLTARNYFVSGTYYFENVQISAGTQEIVGGARASTEENLNATAPCGSDPGGTVGTGVKFILGGTSTLSASNPRGKIELFARRGAPASEGTQGISVQTVQGTDSPLNPPVPGGWRASTLGTSDTVMSVGNGTNPRLTVHGLVYVPNAFVDFSATNSSMAQLRGGIVASRLKLQSSASASGLAVSIDSGEAVRQITIVSTAAGVDPGERSVTAMAVVNVTNDLDISGGPTRSLTIQSWTTH